MGWLMRAVLLGILTAAVAMTLPAQHGGLARGGLAPSSTAIGAGALTRGPSSTARSTAPARASVFTPGAGFRGSGYRNGGFNRSRGAYGRDNGRMPFAYWISPYYYPAFDYGTDESYAGPDNDMPPPDDPGMDAAIAAQNALVDQVRRLSMQVAQLQEGQQVQAPQSAQEQEPLPPQIPVTLVLRNGQQLQVQNYAVMDQTFWDFSRQTVRKIPLSSIDVTASARATEAKGGEFPQLATP